MILQTVSSIISLIFIICFLYQLYYIVTALLTKPAVCRAETNRKYAVLIAARNEESVIGDLIDSVKLQKYPASLIDIIVCADNCTDSTAAVARSHGATVIERCNNEEIGKGYALDHIFTYINTTLGDSFYDGYFVFDADNILDENFVSEMNNFFDNGCQVVTGYRNSKNYASSWVSASQSLYFMRESRYLNNARMLLGNGAMLSGTGFLVSSEIIRANGGWKYFLLSEDLQFTADLAVANIKPAYCDSAIFYDEQPITFSQSWNQRLRWVKGGLTVFTQYGGKMFRGIFRKGGFTCFDTLVSLSPVLMLNAFRLLTHPLRTLASFYLLMLGFGLLTVCSEWKRIHAPDLIKVLSAFIFPVFLITQLPLSYISLFKNVKWTQISHTVSSQQQIQLPKISSAVKINNK
jgi:Glycosyltransferases, probably involved in cell wall biogenesis